MDGCLVGGLVRSGAWLMGGLVRSGWWLNCLLVLLVAVIVGRNIVVVVKK